MHAGGICDRISDHQSVVFIRLKTEVNFCISPFDITRSIFKIGKFLLKYVVPGYQQIMKHFRAKIICAILLIAFLSSNLMLLPSAAAISISPDTHGTVITVKNPFTAGYGVEAANYSVTGVDGSWIQPKFSCSGSTPSSAGFGIQIDGFNGKDIEIVGTGGGCSNGVPKYAAFYAFVPTTSLEVFNIKISPGDKMFASMAYSSSTNMFTAYLKDESSGKSARATGSVPSAQRNSVEAGVVSEVNSTSQCCLALAKFSRIPFGMDHTHVSATCYATISGVTGPIGSFGTVLKLVMTNVSGNAVRASPSELSKDNSSFKISWKSAGP